MSERLLFNKDEDRSSVHSYINDLVGLIDNWYLLSLDRCCCKNCRDQRISTRRCILWSRRSVDFVLIEFLHRDSDSDRHLFRVILASSFRYSLSLPITLCYRQLMTTIKWWQASQIELVHRYSWCDHGEGMCDESKKGKLTFHHASPIQRQLLPRHHVFLQGQPSVGWTRCLLTVGCLSGAELKSRKRWQCALPVGRGRLTPESMHGIIDVCSFLGVKKTCEPNDETGRFTRFVAVVVYVAEVGIHDELDSTTANATKRSSYIGVNVLTAASWVTESQLPRLKANNGCIALALKTVHWLISFPCCSLIRARRMLKNLTRKERKAIDEESDWFQCWTLFQ